MLDSVRDVAFYSLRTINIVNKKDALRRYNFFLFPAVNKDILYDSQ